jgi:hypothetical protein
MDSNIAMVLGFAVGFLMGGLIGVLATYYPHSG